MSYADRVAMRELIWDEHLRVDADYRNLIGQTPTVGEPSSRSDISDSSELSQAYAVKRDETAERMAFVAEMEGLEEAQGEAFEARRMESNDYTVDA